MVSIDISLAFDDALYLIPQIYLLIESLKGKLPIESTIHVTTTKDKPILQYIQEAFPNNIKFYFKSPISELKSRCSYLLRTMEIDSSADYVLKIDLDILFLRDFTELFNVLKTDVDFIIQGENRRVIQNDVLEMRIWRMIYKEFGLEVPTFKFRYIENDEKGLPLFNSGAFIIKTDKMKEVARDWIQMTKICEKWIHYGIHPNEMALSAMIFKNYWSYVGLSGWMHFNPIAHYRKGLYPSQDLIENCELPKEIFLLHWHKPQWLSHLAKYNSNIQQIINQVKNGIPSEWWNLPLETYMEKT